MHTLDGEQLLAGLASDVLTEQVPAQVQGLHNGGRVVDGLETLGTVPHHV